GTGTGFVAMGLASKAAKVYGFDASPEMLAVAHRLLKVEVDLGQEQRTLVAGVAHQYAPPGLN
ncbi:MAG: methyltransferase domain-containing protein, partial [Chloroflexi bacterium]|nr:methyltransferase domain-containing protein [Chloroflexota bacterium]